MQGSRAEAEEATDERQGDRGEKTEEEKEMTGERRGMERKPSLHNIISFMPSTSGKNKTVVKLSHVRRVSRPPRACTPAAHTTHTSLVPTMRVEYFWLMCEGRCTV